MTMAKLTSSSLRCSSSASSASEAVAWSSAPPAPGASCSVPGTPSASAAVPLALPRPLPLTLLPLPPRAFLALAERLMDEPERLRLAALPTLLLPLARPDLCEPAHTRAGLSLPGRSECVVDSKCTLPSAHDTLGHETDPWIPGCHARTHAVQPEVAWTEHT